MGPGQLLAVGALGVINIAGALYLGNLFASPYLVTQPRASSLAPHLPARSRELADTLCSAWLCCTR
eukprot:917548-Rhodomonas_salina.1